MTSFDDIRSGSVIVYPYLWERQSSRGETSGRKDRPTAVGLRLSRAQGDALLLFPITTQPPGNDRFAIEIPQLEKRRAGLDVSVKSWVVLDEFNEDIVTRSHNLSPKPPLGEFSRAFFMLMMRQFMARRSAAKSVRRYE